MKRSLETSCSDFRFARRYYESEDSTSPPSTRSSRGLWLLSSLSFSFCPDVVRRKSDLECVRQRARMVARGGAKCLQPALKCFSTTSQRGNEQAKQAKFRIRPLQHRHFQSPALA